MDQHTKGKWHTGSNGHETIIYDEKGWAVANATVFHGRHNGPEEAKANARRIVACVNTLASVSTEQLETAAKLGIEDVLSGNLFSARLKLQQECDELKAELKRINSKIPEAIQLATEGHMESGVAMMAEQLTKAEAEAKREREYRISEVEKWKRNAENPMFSGRIDTWQAACGIARGERDKARAERDALAADRDKWEKIARDKSMEVLDWSGRCQEMQHQRDDLLNKLNELEKQEPVAWFMNTNRMNGRPATYEHVADHAVGQEGTFPLYARPIPAEMVGYTLPVGSMGSKKLAQLGGVEHWLPIGLVLHNNVESVAITEHGRVTWGDSPASCQKDEPVNARLLGVLKQAHMALIGYLPAHRNPITDAAIESCNSAIAAAEAEQNRQSKPEISPWTPEDKEALGAAITAALSPSHSHAAQLDHDELTRAARAVVERWDSPLWKDLPHTAEYIDALRRALAATPAMPPTPCQGHAAQQEIDEHYEALEREHMGDPDKQTGIYHPDVIAAVRQREAEKPVSLRDCNSNHGRPARSAGHQCLYRMRSTDPACTGCIDRGEG